MFQSTHPRGVRPTVGWRKGRRLQSFNPRTREGCDTRRMETATRLRACFNPRTREGCDERFAFCALAKFSFNPRTREGCDTAVSAHGACQVRFNPRTREGCDAVAAGSALLPLQFQSTHPRGVRPRGYANPLSFTVVSIHAPARGATCTMCRIWKLCPSFQSTHPRGVRQQFARGFEAYLRVSIHAPARGATLLQ